MEWRLFLNVNQIEGDSRHKPVNKPYDSISEDGKLLNRLEGQKSMSDEFIDWLHLITKQLKIKEHLF